MATGGIAEQEQTLSEDEYFVLCDSRSNTDDSRNSAFGMVKKSQIIGKVSFRLKPFSRVTKPEQKTTQTQERGELIMHFQWYPGHMTKAKRAMQEDIKLIDVIVELVDARIPRSSKNPDIDALANGKSRILLLNKSDMADPAQTARWKAYYEKQGAFCTGCQFHQTQRTKSS